MKKVILFVSILFFSLGLKAQTLLFKNLVMSKVIVYKNVNNLVISNKSITGGNSPCIYLINCTKVHITHCKLLNTTDMAVHLNNCTNVLIDSNYVFNTKNGIYAENCPNGGIQINNNQIDKTQGAAVVQQNDPIQFNRVGGGNNRVLRNQIQNALGASKQEDAINMYKSNGLPSDPILIEYNQILGGGNSITGSGITVGDQDGSYITVAYNKLVNPGYAGIDCAGGHNIVIISNWIYSANLAWSGGGLTSANYTANTKSYNNTIQNNSVNWIAGHLGGYRRDTAYKANNNQMPAGWKNNIVKANINASLLPSKLF